MINDESRTIAEKLFDIMIGFDSMDYEDFKETEINCLAEAIDALKNNQTSKHFDILYNALRFITD